MSTSTQRRDKKRAARSRASRAKAAQRAHSNQQQRTALNEAELAYRVAKKELRDGHPELSLERDLAAHLATVTPTTKVVR